MEIFLLLPRSVFVASVLWKMAPPLLAVSPVVSGGADSLVRLAVIGC